MRSLFREKRVVYISQPLPPREITDKDGNLTGLSENIWDSPVKLFINVKPITSQLERQSFGTDVQNILKAQFTPFDSDGFIPVEKSAAWIGVIPNGIYSDGNPGIRMNNNYIVEQVLNTGNQISVYFHKTAGQIKA